MRKQIIPLLLVLSVSLVISPAQAKQETITYEQLLSITGPQTVHVLAKTDEPNDIIGSNLTTKTTWDLLIKNDQGDYVKRHGSIRQDEPFREGTRITARRNHPHGDSR